MINLRQIKHLGTFWASILLAAGLAGAQTRPSSGVRTNFTNAESWPDSEGVHINAHGGGVLFHEGLYYWYGESRGNRTPETRWPPSPGVSVYTSTDLYNWKNAGIAMPTVDDPASDIVRGCTIERPKVIYNEQTQKFVMWFHLELKGKGYSAARTAIAVADAPTGPFKFIRSFRPNAGKWPLSMEAGQRTPWTREESDAAFRANWRETLVQGGYVRRDFDGGQMARDMTLFVDPDTKKGYLIASGEENFTLHLHELTDDYLDVTGKWTRIAPGGHNEAPALVKHEGAYYMLASGCTGWAPNPARYLKATDLWGEWKNAGNPCVGVNPRNGLGPDKTWGGQSTFLLPLPGRPGRFIAMFDEWRPQNLITSGYLWLPAKIEDGKLSIEWRDTWSLSD